MAEGILAAARLRQAGAAIGMQDMACGDAAAAAAAVREGGQGAAPMELAAVNIAVDVCVLEGSLEVEGFPDAASDDPFDVAALFPESRLFFCFRVYVPYALPR